eukprot:gene19134-biopygen16028
MRRSKGRGDPRGNPVPSASPRQRPPLNQAAGPKSRYRCDPPPLKSTGGPTGPRRSPTGPRRSSDGPRRAPDGPPTGPRRCPGVPRRSTGTPPTDLDLQFAPGYCAGEFFGSEVHSFTNAGVGFAILEILLGKSGRPGIFKQAPRSHALYKRGGGGAKAGPGPPPPPRAVQLWASTACAAAGAGLAAPQAPGWQSCVICAGVSFLFGWHMDVWLAQGGAQILLPGGSPGPGANRPAESSGQHGHPFPGGGKVVCRLDILPSRMGLDAMSIPLVLYTM